MSRTFSTLFSGGGLADVGMMQAGWTPLWGVEHDAAIAGVYRQNVGAHVIVGDARSIYYEALDRPDHLHASPPCTRASVANSDATESPLDGELAEAVCRAIRALRPHTFTLENVYGYRRFDAYKRICATLNACGYWWEQHHLNSADFGVPQTRKRLFVRATLGGWLCPLPSPVSWVGWYASIEDLIPTLPESAFAPWQLARLPEVLTGSFYTIPQQSDDKKGTETGYGCPRRNPDEPALTMTSSQTPSWYKAFLCHGTSTLEVRDAAEPAAAVLATVHAKAAMPRAFVDQNLRRYLSGTMGLDAFLMPLQGEHADARGQAPPALTVTANHAAEKSRAFIVEQANGSRLQTIRQADEPVFTVPVHSVRHPAPRAWLSQGRVVSMTPRALARFQSVPDWYELPMNKKLACIVLGNGVPCLLMQRIAESLT